MARSKDGKAKDKGSAKDAKTAEKVPAKTQPALDLPPTKAAKKAKTAPAAAEPVYVEAQPAAPSAAMSKSAGSKPAGAKAANSKADGARASADEPAKATTKPEPTPHAKAQAKPQPAPVASLADTLQAQTSESFQKLSANLVDAALIAQRAALRMSESPAAREALAEPDPFHAGDAIGKVMSQLAASPSDMAQAHGDLLQAYAQIWQKTTARMLGQADSDDAPTDKRFRDPEWTQNLYFSLLRDTYLATSTWMTSLVQRAAGIDAIERRKAAFFMRQAVDAMSPTNFLMTNPTALRATLQSGGENLVRGAEHFVKDLTRGHGRLAITQVDGTPFELGRNIAATPGKVVWRDELFELIQYTPQTDKVRARPLLFFPPWINKFYILDLTPRNSMVKYLTEQGFTVFLVSWVNPDAQMAAKTFEDYMHQGMLRAIAKVLETTGERQLDAIGYCIAGTLLSTTLAYMAQVGDDRVASATFFAAQADFQEAGDLLVFTDDAALDYVERQMEQHGGVLDSQAMADTFNALRSNDLVWNYVVDNYYLGKDPPPFDLLNWNADQTRMPRALHMFYLRRFYRDNALARGQLEIDGVRLDPGAVKIPMFVQAAREDHIAPYNSVYRGARLYGGPVEFLMAGSGHIAGVINHPAANKYQHWLNSDLPQTVTQWMAGAREVPGSWWPHWEAWLRGLDNRLVKARMPGEGPLAAIEDAPGSYVRVRSQS